MKRFTLRVTLSTLVSALILVSALSVTTVLYLGTKRALYQTTFQMMDQISSSVGDKLTQRLFRVERLNTLIANLIRSGALDLRDEAKFTDFLADAVAANPSISLIDCGLPSGAKFQAVRMADGSISKRLVHRLPRGVVSTWVHQNPAYAATETGGVEDLATGYDPRTRPWYQSAAQAGKRTWTGLYPSRAGLNYANAMPVYGPRGELRCVLAIDMRLEDLSRFLNHLRVGRTGKPFILSPDLQVVAMPLAQEQDLGPLVKKTVAGGWSDYALRDPGELPDAAVRQAVLAYRASPRNRDQGYLAFRDAAGRRLLASFEPEPKYKFTFGVVVAEADILGPIQRDLDVTFLLICACLLLALAVAYGLARSIARPLATLAGQVDRIRQLDLADAPPVRTAILEVALIGDSVQSMRKGLRSFKKYVPADVVTRLLHLGQEAVIEGERRELTLFFSDIADFTRISEQLRAEDLVARLGLYLEEVARALLAEAATVDKFIGDSVMAFWGAPNPRADHALAACRAALRAQAAIQALNQRWAAEGGPAFHTRMGIHTGDAIVGNVGFEGRMNYTAVGDSVNLASRLEGLNKQYGTRILVSEATLGAAGDAVLARMVDRVAVKGQDRPIAVFELLAGSAEATPEQVAKAGRSARAFAAYRGRRWEEALAILQDQPGEPDGPDRVLLERCRRYRAQPPEADWDGVIRYREK
jgi:adenylate cyclase